MFIVPEFIATAEGTIAAAPLTITPDVTVSYLQLVASGPAGALPSLALM